MKENGEIRRKTESERQRTKENESDESDEASGFCVILSEHQIRFQ